MATGLEQYYSQWGNALGSAAGGLLGSATTTSTMDMDNLLVVPNNLGLGSYYYTHPQQQYALTADMLQPLVESSKKVVDKSKKILDRLRSEICGWCENVLEVA